MNEELIQHEEQVKTGKRRRRRSNGGGNRDGATTTDYQALPPENDSYVPPTPEDFNNVFSESLITSGKFEAGSALLVAVLANLAEQQLGSGAIVGLFVGHALIFGGIKEALRLKLMSQYNEAQTDDNEKMKYTWKNGLSALAKSVAGPFILSETIGHSPEITKWALENPVFTLSTIAITLGIKNYQKIGNEVMNAYRGVTEGFKTAANNAIDYVSSISYQHPVYDIQSPVVLQNPIVETRSIIKEKRGMFKWRWPFTRRSRESEAENPTS